MSRYCYKPEDISILASRGRLTEIQQQLSVIEKLNTELRLCLQSEKLSFCQVTSIKAGRAVILCSSAAWTTRLKMQRAAILDNFRQKILPDLAGIDIETSPDGQIKQINTPTPAPNRHTLSDEAASALKAAAQNSDGKLKEALLKLAENARRPR